MHSFIMGYQLICKMMVPREKPWSYKGCLTIKRKDESKWEESKRLPKGHEDVTKVLESFHILITRGHCGDLRAHITNA